VRPGSAGGDTGHTGRAMSRWRGDDLLQLPVVLHGIRVGQVVDIVLDAGAERALGLDVLCLDGQNRFLPLATAEVGEDSVAVHSSLALLDDAQFDFYREHGRTLRALRSSGRASDVVFGDDWLVDQLVGAGEPTA
jgi:hypothetical protein